MAEVGYISVVAALVLALYGAMAGPVGVKLRWAPLVRTAQYVVPAQLVLVTAAALALVYALAANDFSWRVQATVQEPVLAEADHRYRVQLTQELEAMDLVDVVLDTPRSPGDGTAHKAWQEWQAERAVLYGAIKELELDYHAAKLSEGDYHMLRQRYEGRGVTLLKRLEAARGKERTASGVPETRPSTPRTHRPAEVDAGTRQVGPRSPLRLAVGTVALVSFGVALGFLLASSLRVRMEAQLFRPLRAG